MHQEGQLASIKEPRSPTTNKNKAKRRTIYCEGGGTRWRPKSLPPPPTPVAIFRLRPANFQKKYPDLEKWPAEFPKFPNAPPDFR
jgi:hypothetical protein